MNFKKVELQLIISPLMTQLKERFQSNLWDTIYKVFSYFEILIYKELIFPKLQ